MNWFGKNGVVEGGNSFEEDMLFGCCNEMVCVFLTQSDGVEFIRSWPGGVKDTSVAAHILLFTHSKLTLLTAFGSRHLKGIFILLYPLLAFEPIICSICTPIRNRNTISCISVAIFGLAPWNPSQSPRREPSCRQDSLPTTSHVK
jgi:hypothetical protein